ncbi:hypothetical protein GOODEAATRI_011294 [Goodea atripinnis]|uniref:Uncharacterized protein n=1 Tax=Goodea atripinnis TaxID=208336 RepID=A0ABV0PMN6_9TELE
MFHEGMQSGMFGDNDDGYVSKTIAMCDPSVSGDSLRRANKSLDHIVQHGVRVLSERLYLHIRLLVAEVHRRVVMEYLRSIMRGRIICTSMKMRKRMAGRLRDEGKQIKVLFKDLPPSNISSSLSVFRKKHVSAILNIRGMTRQAERQEILNIVKDIENCDAGLSPLSRDRALFSEVPVTSEVHCLNVGLSRIALTASSCVSALRPRRRKTRTPVQENPEEVL